MYIYIYIYILYIYIYIRLVGGPERRGLSCASYVEYCEKSGISEDVRWFQARASER